MHILTTNLHNDLERDGGRQGFFSLFLSKEKTSLLGGGSIETGEMPPGVEEYDVTRRT